MEQRMVAPDDGEPYQQPERDVVTVLIADDHPLIVRAMELCIDGDPHLEIVATAADGEEMCERYAKVRPDVVLADHDMPGLSGVDAAQRILRDDPDAKIIFFSAFDSDEMVVSALEVGAVGYLLKTTDGSELCEKIRDAANGEIVFDSRTARIMARGLRSFARRAKGTPGGGTLSERETEVLGLVAEGLTNAKIGDRLYISPQTVKTHLEHIYQKLGVNDRASAVRRGIEIGAIGTASRLPAHR